MPAEIENTDLQERFAHAFVVDAPGSAAKAARLAGYAEKSARITAHRLLHNPRIQARIREIQFRELNGKLASKALGVLEAILDDPGAPPGVRVDACRCVLDRAGLVLSEQPQKQNDARVVDLSALLARLHEARALAAGRALPGVVDVTSGR